ncbi:MAG: S49 family peptidase, partial [Bacteroidales bacterium]
MEKFLKYTLAVMTGTVLGLVIFSILSVIVFVGLIGIAMTATTFSTGDPNESKVLVVKLNTPIVEKSSDEYSSITKMFGMEPQLALNDILDNIHRAKNDTKIEGIFLQIPDVQAGVSTIREIREALENFKQSGKFIIAHSDVYSQAGYYLSSVADKVYISPEGLLEFKGIAARVLFIKRTMEKIGLEPQILRHGKYKSAIEMFDRESMSKENREQISAYIREIWQTVVNDIAESRNTSAPYLNNLADSLLVRNSYDAVKYGLIDEIKYYDEVLKEIKDSLRLEASKKIPVINLSDYIDNSI